MAEARLREEGEEGERRVRNRSHPTDHPERTKPDHLHLSQGPLSSIRAAIKRTRTNSQSDHTRERRRPEITIVSAEPLDRRNWLSGTSGVFPRPPQSGWSAGIQAVSQPPPSYDQVIQEKTQEEHIVKPTAAPRRATCTTTSATQTDPVRNDTSTPVPQCSAAPQSAVKRPAGKKPQKPPRPSLPKPVDREPVTKAVAPADEKVGTKTAGSTNTEDQSDSKPGVKQTNRADSPPTCSRSVTVHWDFPTKHLTATAETTRSSPDSEHGQRPVPLPRTKSRKQTITEVVKVQTLVELSEDCDSICSDPEVVSSNEYLKELLEAFSADNECEENGDIVDQSDEALQGEDAGDEMNPNHSQRNILARIQAFETQTSTEEGNAVQPAKSKPLIRKVTIKPPVAAKPSVALRPQLNHSVDNDYQNVSTTNIPPSPTTAPRPQPPKKPAELSLQGELKTLLNKTANLNRSRPSVLTRPNSIFEEDTPPVPPTPPEKTFKEPLKPNLNINNHNSVSVVRHEYAESSSSHIPSKPQHNVDSNGDLVACRITRRPTTIRVPSKTGSYPFQDSPPPLPAQRPIGSLNTSVKPRQAPSLSRQDSFQFAPEPSLPPRRQMSLPPRPPSGKISPGRPPPPSIQRTGRSQSVSLEASPKPQAQKPHRKGPVLPPRPNPGHRLYNQYTLQIPHGIAASNYNGSNTGELSFQKNEVLLLLEEIDNNTFECQVGEARGRVHKSRMMVINPLSSVSHISQPQGASPAGGAGSELKVQAIHDFNPEGPGELALRAGDVVTMVEQLDSEWYTGTCRGSTGFFPINYVKALSNSPKPLPERKARPPPATASGPRCVARFDFEAENSDELSFSEGDVIQLKALVGQDWARGQLGVSTGIFPLNFVDVIEDLPAPSSQQKRQSISIPMPGMATSPSTHPEVSKPAPVSQSDVEWVVAQYDYAGNSDDDLSFQQGDCILIRQHLDAEWSCGRLNGREGMFPRAFVESTKGQLSCDRLPIQAAAPAARGRALYNFTSDCEEELSLQVGDIITDLESVDDEWFLGDLRGKRAMVPKNYVKVLK
ncbi:SH3 domain-containing protein 19 isoform X2 [Sander lucioperca]|uniref:SH3 domain-containing protein 19 isoform X2 n=1 Tax=Sander lucioperca TaxID=283035 RepID=UPI00125D491C|nr:SH3 domain-containing protein 19 isoform X2 [Sander lucioperca]